MGLKETKDMKFTFASCVSTIDAKAGCTQIETVLALGA